MRINDLVEMTIFLYLICSSIYAKMQGFVVECVFFFFFFFFIYAEIQDVLENLPVDCAHTLWVKNFVEIALSLGFVGNVASRLC